MACCHVADGTRAEDTVVAALAIEHGQHEHGHSSHRDAGSMDELTIDHGDNHCPEGTVSFANPPCTDIQKTSNDLRPIHFVAALIVVTHLLPSPANASVRDAAIPDPSPPPRHRPLHLEKSVLLI